MRKGKIVRLHIHRPAAHAAIPFRITPSPVTNTLDAVIRELHHRKIAIEGNLMFGFDEDDDGVFERIAQFTIDAGIDLPEFYVLTPYPDTELCTRFKRDGRIVDQNWAHYDNTHFHYLPVFQPRNMSREALREGCRQAGRPSTGDATSCVGNGVRGYGACPPGWPTTSIPTVSKPDTTLSR